MKNLVIFLALCTLAAAMVPGERRSEDITKQKCNPSTPCGWGVLKPNSKIEESFIYNTFCDCPSDLKCEESELDENSYIYRCRASKLEKRDAQWGH